MGPPLLPVAGGRNRYQFDGRAQLHESSSNPVGLPSSKRTSASAKSDCGGRFHAKASVQYLKGDSANWEGFILTFSRKPE